jgi:hypothetical protein
VIGVSGLTITGGNGTVGGGINNSASLTLTNCTISGNTGVDAGGIENFGALNITGSTISNNSANVGGFSNAGGISDSNNGAGMTITNSTISGNTASASGDNIGGILHFNGTLIITSCTITNNKAQGGVNNAGGVRVLGGSTTVSNTIIAANQNNSTVADVDGAFTSNGYNLIGNVGAASGFNQTADQTGTGAAPLNPKLGALAFNGGPTQTHFLIAGSPAIDQGKSFGLTTDQRGDTRPVDNPSIPKPPGGDGSDIGAYESQNPTAAGASISGMVTTGDGQPSAGVVMTLRATVDETTVTDSSGHYEFADLSANQFYIVTPQLANFSFSPANRSFSLLGNKADAIFTAIPTPIATANPLDTNEYFVRQQYLDFLGREPDQPGLDYWSAALNQCNGDAACLGAQRIEVSAAFFASVEFQQSGSFVYRMYKAGLGRLLSYAEFTAGRTQILAGGSSVTRRAAFANAFVQQPEFVQKFQTNVTAESFVDALLAQTSESSQVDLSSQRSQMIATYQTGGSMNEGRALVLQMVTEDGSFQRAEYNPSFVLMEYFGYLQRDPDPSGYQFWLSVLNSSTGNYHGMVCSFVTSAEYQRRFAPVVTRTNQDCGA